MGCDVFEGSDYCVITPPTSGVINSGIDIDTYDDHRMAMAFSLAACGGVAWGLLRKKHSTHVASPPPPHPPYTMRVFVSVHPEGKSCSDLGRVLVVNDPTAWA